MNPNIFERNTIVSGVRVININIRLPQRRHHCRFVLIANIVAIVQLGTGEVFGSLGVIFKKKNWLLINTASFLGGSGATNEPTQYV